MRYDGVTERGPLSCTRRHTLSHTSSGSSLPHAAATNLRNLHTRTQHASAMLVKAESLATTATVSVVQVSLRVCERANLLAYLSGSTAEMLSTSYLRLLNCTRATTWTCACQHCEVGKRNLCFDLLLHAVLDQDIDDTHEVIPVHMYICIPNDEKPRIQMQ